MRSTTAMAMTWERLQGATIHERIVEHNGEIEGLAVTLRDGTHACLWIQQDAEGNGPGWAELMEIEGHPPCSFCGSKDHQRGLCPKFTGRETYQLIDSDGRRYALGSREHCEAESDRLLDGAGHIEPTGS